MAVSLISEIVASHVAFYQWYVGIEIHYRFFLLGVCGLGLLTLPLLLFAGGISADPVFVSIMFLFLWYGYWLFAFVLKWRI